MGIKYYISVAALATGAIAAYPQEQADTISSLYDELEELVITAKKEVVKSDGAKLTYDLEQDDSSKGQSVLDALRKVPMVTVDGQDNIYIKGSQDFRIYINGKEDPMLTANASKVLKAMPSESVSKIEVITEPGAKYDAEGTSGILNLITERKQRKDGYTGSASLSATTQNFSASLYGRMKYDKVTADASINYANNDLQRQTNIGEEHTINHTSDEMYEQVARMNQSVSFNYIGASLNLSWEPSEKDLFSFGADVNDIEGNVRRIDFRNDMYNRAGNLQWSTFQKIRGTMKNLGASGNLSYRRMLGETGQSLTAAYRFSFGRNPWDLRYSNSVEEGDTYITPFQRNLNSTYQREHTVTADYMNPIADGKHTIEAGVKGIFRYNSAITKQLAGLSEDMMQIMPDDCGHTDQIQNVYAAYASYSGKFDKIAVTAGLRYEHTYMGLDFIENTYNNFRRNLDDVTPNAAITYMFGPANNLRLAYQMRINRPAINQMNPTEFRLTQTLVQVGNPDLESEHYNSLSLTYSNFGRVIGGNVSISYFQSNNTIEDYVYIKDGVTYQTNGNFGHNRKAEVSGFFNWNISDRITFSVNGTVNYTNIRSGDGSLGNHGWNGNYGGNFAYTGPWKVKYTLYGGESTGTVRLQGEYSGWYYYGIGISRSFLKDDALTLSVNANNFLTKYTIFKSSTYTGTHSVNNTNKSRNWNVGITLSWNFGHLQDQVKKTGADLENDDTKSTGGKGIGL